MSFLKGRVVPEEECGIVMPLHLSTDCRSLYDHLHREGVPKPASEQRLAIELAAIRQALAIEGRHLWRAVHGTGEVRPDRPMKPPIHWLPTDQQWADILTKKMSSTVWWTMVGEGRLRFPLALPGQSSNMEDAEAV